MILATYDGAYLHLWKYELFNLKESEFEHKIHTARAIFFPIIVYFLFIQTDQTSLWIAFLLITADLVALGMDALSEKESRSFMGGLPKWEYVLHLFSNGLHFSSIILMIATRVNVDQNGLSYSNEFQSLPSFETVQLIAINIIPGAVVLGAFHVFLSLDFGKKLYTSTRLKITCC